MTSYTHITFSTPRARVEYSEAALENRARDVARIYEGLREDANDGAFSLWGMDDLVVALHALGDEVYELDRAREGEKIVPAEIPHRDLSDPHG